METYVLVVLRLNRMSCARVVKFLTPRPPPSTTDITPAHPGRPVLVWWWWCCTSTFFRSYSSFFSPLSDVTQKGYYTTLSMEYSHRFISNQSPNGVYVSGQSSIIKRKRRRSRHHVGIGNKLLRIVERVGIFVRNWSKTCFFQLFFAWFLYPHPLSGTQNIY